MTFTVAKSVLKRDYFCTVIKGSKRGLYNLLFAPEDCPEQLLEDYTKKEVVELVEKMEASAKEDETIFQLN